MSKWFKILPNAKNQVLHRVVKFCQIWSQVLLCTTCSYLLNSSHYSLTYFKLIIRWPNCQSIKLLFQVKLLCQLADKLGNGEPVSLPDVVEQAESVILDHNGVRVNGLLSFVHPTLDDFKTCKPTWFGVINTKSQITRNVAKCLL